MVENSLRVRPGQSRTPSSASQPYITQANASLLPEGPVDQEAAQLLEEFVGTREHHLPESADTNDADSEDNDWKALPWWKRPSPLWMLCLIPFSAMAQGATLAPKVELYTMLACRAVKPDIFDEGIFDPTIPTALSLLSSLTPSISKMETLSPSSCASDPTVQAAVAQLSAVITTTTGVLSLLTTAWWGALSDRRGRVFVMAIALIGLLITDFNYVNVYYFSQHLPGGYWFLLLGPLIEGILGGFATATATIHGYLADTTNEKTRSGVFSLNLGLLFIGFAVGPALGSLLISYTGRTISVFIAAGIIHVIYATFICTIVPESLSQSRMQEAKRNHARRTNEPLIRHHNPLIRAAQARAKRLFIPPSHWQARVERLFMFMSPLSVFSPDLRPHSNPLKKPKRDWNLTLLAAAYGFAMALMASYTYSFQYAAATFGWDSVKLGYYVSIVGASRALFLTVLLPVAIKLFKPEPLVIDMPSTPSETEPLLSRAEETTPPASTTPSAPAGPSSRKVLHSPTFELIVVRVSIVVEIVAYSLMGLASTGSAYAMSAVLAALGVGLSPALQTVALAMYARKGGSETGRLFGALSVVQALSSQVLGPTIYGLVYMKTVAFFPRAIFIVSVTGLFLSLLSISFVSLPKDEELKREILASHSHAEDANSAPEAP
ncbi:major facilitator superfamily domain-containing protein [Coprinopsis sp. MPI-PUGE-AT-0042]|nr:major facilitator superfamily domain-containing protein [Coprinopsis sp. MPI-PUGE-AT-0042]